MEIIPLIDVIFFLLATFVLFTLSLNRIRSIPVDLPFPGKESGEETLVIQVSADGAIYWNRELITGGELPGRLAIYRTQVESPRVVVTGDDQARFGPTVAVIDLVRRAGLGKFVVETRLRPTGK